MGEMITIPLDEYQALRHAAEELGDLRAFDRAKMAIASGDDELVPAETLRRLLAGEAPLRVWRKLRGLTQSALARASGVNRVQIADIEAGRRKGSLETARKLADALGVSIDDLA
ncbi:helix-turn-helix transcriptional regulator [Novosphingobium taihuense]|uniref:mRNA interferase RelE/StbE n=1 Tax=Novosphingobium taihuense TaxID=260085 RepID=A0A7W7AAG1_9SPHN|nr:helix-turn-helix transcriptional regulator [Novosphingobium taihuense]MBB4613267.1 mRNA interferase RelE/StbE [Novosphingobium taihuense]TWH85408.1 DNA-binding XRE family transcriptional regulator [Novosphingobium taihuense]